MNTHDPKQNPAFYTGRGPGRGMDIKRGAPKKSGRGLAGSPGPEIDLSNLEQPGTGPVNFAPKKGTKFEQPLAGGSDMADSDD